MQSLPNLMSYSGILVHKYSPDAHHLLFALIISQNRYRRNRQGAIAAWLCAGCFILGLILIFIIAPEFNTGAQARLQIFMQHSRLMQLWYFVVYVVFALALLMLSIVLLEFDIRENRGKEQLATIMSYLWACYILASGLIAILSIEFLFTLDASNNVQISQTWQAMYEVQLGLGEGIEWVGAIWVLLINLCLLKQQRFPLSLIYFGFTVSVIGLFTIVPALSLMGAGFGMLQSIWFIWLGYLLWTRIGKATK